MKNFLLPLAAFVTVSALAQTTPLIVGMLEEMNEEQVQTYKLGTHGVRVLFQKNGAEWNAFPGADCSDQKCLQQVLSAYPAQGAWTIAFDGRSLGEVKSKRPAKHGYYASVGLQTISGKAPQIGKASEQFGDLPVHRPLVAVSQPNFKDPEGWKPRALGKDNEALLRQSFRKRHPKVVRCSGPEPIKPTPWNYKDEDLVVLSAYASADNRRIALIALGDDGCEDPEPQAALTSQWYLIDANGKTAEAFGEGMWLVDAGDYDADGKSELVFAVRGYNLAGYRIVYDDFKKSAAFEFSFH